jgi:drug/metabolite transporter (DMT)-like permease
MIVGAWILRRSSSHTSEKSVPTSERNARRWRDALAAGAMSGTAYGLVLWAQTRADLASVAALRETSIVFAAVIGAVMLGEPAGRARIVASCAIAGGGVVLAPSG